MTKVKTYQKQRFLFFWLAVVFFFVPCIAATSCLLPPVSAAHGVKWSIGLAIIFLHSLAFIGGLFRKLLAHVIFVDWFALGFLCLAGFFLMDVFHDYRFTFLTIESVSFAGSVFACVFAALHRKYKRQAQTVRTVRKSGILGGK